MNVQATKYGEGLRVLSSSHRWLRRLGGGRVGWSGQTLLAVLALMSLEASADLMVRQSAGAAARIQADGYRKTAEPGGQVLRLGLKPVQPSVTPASSEQLDCSAAGEFRVRIAARGVCVTEPVPPSLHVEASTFYAGQMRAPAGRGWDDSEATGGNFLLAREIFRADPPQAFDGSNYALLNLSFRQGPAAQPQQLALCDLATGEVLMPSAASVTPQARPLDPVAQGPAGRVLLAGGLLFGLLCCRRQPLQSLKSAPALADLHWPELNADTAVAVATLALPQTAAASCIYNRLLRALAPESAFEPDTKLTPLPLFWRSFQNWDEILALTPHPWKWRPRSS